MTEIYLSPEQKAALEKRHRTERDGRIKDRIKEVAFKIRKLDIGKYCPSAKSTR